MTRRYLPLLALLVVCAGCLGPLGSSSPADTTPTPEPTGGLSESTATPETETSNVTGTPATRKRVEELETAPPEFREAVLSGDLPALENRTLFPSERRALGIDPGDEVLERLALGISNRGYDRNDIAYLRRLANLSAFEREQAERFLLPESLFCDWRDSCTAFNATRADVRALANDDEVLAGVGDRLPAIDTTDRLGADGYTMRELEYLVRLGELRADNDSEYEAWAQVERLGLDNVTSVTDDRLWMIRNNDSDRLINGLEREIGTDPAEADTDSDGYPDHLEWGPMQDIGLDVDPTRPDILVEIHTIPEVSPSEEYTEPIVEAFRTEPDEPINVTFRWCNDSGTVDPRGRALEEFGFHYIVLGDTNINGNWGGAYSDWAAVNIVDGGASTLAHELGHLVGLLPLYDGVDSEELAAEEYQSVMNYNHRTPVTYADRDYERMKAREFGSKDLDALRTLWHGNNVTFSDCIKGK
jgi:hypothetical protein